MCGVPVGSIPKIDAQCECDILMCSAYCAKAKCEDVKLPKAKDMCMKMVASRPVREYPFGIQGVTPLGNTSEAFVGAPCRGGTSSFPPGRA